MMQPVNGLARSSSHKRRDMIVMSIIWWTLTEKQGKYQFNSLCCSVHAVMLVLFHMSALSHYKHYRITTFLCHYVTNVYKV